MKQILSCALSIFCLFSFLSANERCVDLSASIESGRLLPSGIINPGTNLRDMLEVNYNDFSFYVWTDSKVSRTFNSRYDLSGQIDFTRKHNSFIYSIGLQHLAFTNPSSTDTSFNVYMDLFYTPRYLSRERGNFSNAYFGLGFDSLLNPKITVHGIFHTYYRAKLPYLDDVFALFFFGPGYVKVMERRFGYNGLYATLSLSHDFKEIMKLGSVPVFLNIETEITYRDEKVNQFLYGVKRSAFSDANIQINMPIEISNHCRITPYIAASTLIDSKIRKVTSSESKECNFIYGINLAVSFKKNTFSTSTYISL